MPETSSRFSVHPIEQIVADGLCIGCGFCAASLTGAAPGVRVEIGFDDREDSFVPKVTGWTSGLATGDFVCPGATMDMVALAEQVHGRVPEDPMLGTYRALRVCHATDETMRAQAASGGVIPAVLKHLLESKAIDVAYTVVSGGAPIAAKGRLIRSAADIGSIHGSVYHPANFGNDLAELFGGTERFAFVGLPCEVAALEMVKRHRPELAARHVQSIGLFCGGINKFQGIAYYLRAFKLCWSDIKSIAYRVGPWPGKIRVEDTGGATRMIPRIRGNTRWKILRYVVAFQGYWMLKRCRLCPDQVSDFADVAVGDPHSPKYRERGGAGFSATVTRTERGERLLSDMIRAGSLGAEVVDRKTVVDSQGYCLDNRRHMQAYVKVTRAFGGAVPRAKTYPALAESLSFRHFVYAVVDMMKVAAPQSKVVAAFYIPWQVFEYLFITLTPSIILKRFANLLRNT